MSFRNIYVYVDGGAQSAATVSCACRIAKDFSATVTGFVVVPDAVEIATAPEASLMSPVLVKEIQKSSERQASAAEEAFRAVATEYNIQADWIDITAGLEGARAAVATAALCADLIVVSQQATSSPVETDVNLPQDIVVDSGRPIVLIPSVLDNPEFGRSILIAWDESRESSRAVFDAMPFLTRADRVAVITIVDDNTERPADHARLGQLLDRHGVKASVDTLLKKDGESTSDALFRQAKISGSEMLIAGAYGQIRLREGLIGSVSKSIFDSTRLPALMSH